MSGRQGCPLPTPAEPPRQRNLSQIALQAMITKVVIAINRLLFQQPLLLNRSLTCSSRVTTTPGLSIVMSIMMLSSFTD